MVALSRSCYMTELLLWQQLRNAKFCQFRAFSHFCAVLEPGIRQDTSLSHFIIVCPVCVSHLEVQVKIYSYTWNAKTIFSIGHTGKFSFLILFYSMIYYLQAGGKCLLLAQGMSCFLGLSHNFNEQIPCYHRVIGFW